MAKLQLKEDEQRWVQNKWAAIRTAQMIADTANNKWQKLNDEINAFLDRSGETDPIQRAKIKGASLALKDALEAGKWHSANAQRHIDDLNVFLRMKELELL